MPEEKIQREKNAYRNPGTERAISFQNDQLSRERGRLSSGTIPALLIDGNTILEILSFRA
jgi:hypothetical protein